MGNGAARDQRRPKISKVHDGTGWAWVRAFRPSFGIASARNALGRDGLGAARLISASNLGLLSAGYSHKRTMPRRVLLGFRLGSEARACGPSCRPLSVLIRSDRPARPKAEQASAIKRMTTTTAPTPTKHEQGPCPPLPSVHFPPSPPPVRCCGTKTASSAKSIIAHLLLDLLVPALLEGDDLGGGRGRHGFCLRFGDWISLAGRRVFRYARKGQAASGWKMGK